MMRTPGKPGAELHPKVVMQVMTAVYERLDSGVTDPSKRAQLLAAANAGLIRFRLGIGVDDATALIVNVGGHDVISLPVEILGLPVERDCDDEEAVA